MIQINHPKDYFGLIKQIEIFADQRNFKIHPQNRIKNFEKQLDKFLATNYNPWKDPSFNWEYFYQGIRDVTEVYFICQQYSKKPHGVSETDWNLIMGGQPIPYSDKNTTPRNLQFQFFFSSLLMENGFHVEDEEPDIIFLHNNKKYGIATKRLKSEKKIGERVKEGAKQIEKSGHPGLVAISFDQIAQIKGGAIVPSNYIFDNSIAYEILEKTLEKHETIIREQVKNYCIGFIGFLKVLFVKENGTEIFLDSAEKWVAIENDHESSFDLIKSMCNRINI